MSGLGILVVVIRRSRRPECGRRGWPSDWDVDFELHAPGGTVVDCTYAKGRVVHRSVTPRSRAVNLSDWHAHKENEDRPGHPVPEGGGAR